ncbi:hypothetical protein M9H77_27954 [Catharanthus roseus]|uniref:Uncharacterized protein n=1 Tax=Catharanthus roseus TaxID=4058 RepID=A0ACC0AI42_CATRO|nr:hypothetical protein M9H77_27954 [Catharanthus roseus]
MESCVFKISPANSEENLACARFTDDSAEHMAADIRKCHIFYSAMDCFVPNSWMIVSNTRKDAKGRQKTNSTRRDKSYWEHMLIAQRKIQKSSDSRFYGSGSGSGLVWVSMGEVDRNELLGVGLGVGGVGVDENMNGDENYGYRVVADFVFRDQPQWHEVRILNWNVRRTCTFHYSDQRNDNKCEMDTHCPVYTCNGTITIVIESAVGQRLLLTELQIELRGRVISVFTTHLIINHVQENSVGYGSYSRKLCATWKSFRILYPGMSARDKPQHVIVCAMAREYRKYTGPYLRQHM